jgi:hypothetical protein
MPLQRVQEPFGTPCLSDDAVIPKLGRNRVTASLFHDIKYFIMKRKNAESTHQSQPKPKRALSRKQKAMAAAVATGLRNGKSQTQAVLEAGYSPTTAIKLAYKICGSPAVIQALADLGGTIDNKQLENVAKARVMGLLTSKDTDSRTVNQAARTALEVAGRLGSGKDQGHLHLHQLSPQTIELLSKRLAEMSQRASAIDVSNPPPQETPVV